MSRYKRFRAGLVQLDEEGVVHVLRRPDFGDQAPILAAVGDLQFEVARYRFETEFDCPVDMRPTDWVTARVVRGSPSDGHGLRRHPRRGHPRPHRGAVRVVRALAQAGEGSPESISPMGVDASADREGWRGDVADLDVTLAMP